MATQKAIEAAKANAARLSTAWEGVAAWAIYDANGQQVQWVYHAGCHGSFNTTETSYSTVKDSDRIVAIFPVKRSFSPQAMAFLEWMCNEGPGAPFVCNKDNIKDGVIFDLECSGRRIAFWFAKTMRYCSENPHRPIVWKELVDMGVHPLVALIACSGLNASWLKESAMTHCTTFVFPRTIEDLKKALLLKFPIEKRPWHIKNESRDSWDIFWSPPKNGSFYATHGALFEVGKTKQEKVSDGWGGYTYKTVTQSKRDIADHLIELTRMALDGAEPATHEGNSFNGDPSITTSEERKEEKTNERKEERKVRRKTIAKRKVVKRVVAKVKRRKDDDDVGVKPARKRRAAVGGGAIKRLARRA